MVEGVVGLMGMGKTYYTTWRAHEALKAGIRVVANYHIDGAEHCGGWDDLMQATVPHIDDRGIPVRIPTLCIIDEANLWCPSRFWQKLDPRLLYLWSQSRKFSLDILWTAQHEQRVDTALREVSYCVWVCKRLPLGWFLYRSYQIEEMRKEKRHRLASKWVRLRKDICESYNTWEVIDLGVECLRGIERAPDYRAPDEGQHWSEPVFTEKHGSGKRRGLLAVGGSAK